MQQNFLTIAERLRPPELPGANLSEQLKVAAEIRDRIEILHSSHYGAFLSALFPVFQAVLTEITPVVSSKFVTFERVGAKVKSVVTV